MRMTRMVRKMAMVKTKMGKVMMHSSAKSRVGKFCLCLSVSLSLSQSLFFLLFFLFFPFFSLSSPQYISAYRSQCLEMTHQQKYFYIFQLQFVVYLSPASGAAPRAAIFTRRAVACGGFRASQWRHSNVHSTSTASCKWIKQE